MSGSGGFYRYRCKYWLTHNCNNWVYVNGAACAYCVVSFGPWVSDVGHSETDKDCGQADGRESMESETTAPAHHFSREICVPRVCDGTLQYMLMELVESGTGNYWAVRHKVTAQPLVPANMTTSDTPRPIMATTGVPIHQTGSMVQPGY